MAFTELTDDLNIIYALPDEPNDDGGLTAAQLKAKFDEASLKIQTYLNDTHLAEHTAGNTVVTPFTGVESGDVQAALEELYDITQAITLGDIPDGTITSVKLDSGAVTTPKLASDALIMIAKQGKYELLQSYTESGTFTFTVPDAYGDGVDYEIGVFEIGGGGSGGTAKIAATNTYRPAAAGGGSGRTKVITKTVTPGDEITVIVGAGGAAASSGPSDTSTSGNAGGDTSFDGVVAPGGSGGAAHFDSSGGVSGADGGQGSHGKYDIAAPAMGESSAIAATISGSLIVYQGGKTASCEAFNPFDNKKYLGAGGLAYAYSDSSSHYVNAETAPELDDGSSAGAAAGYSGTVDTTSVTAGGATGTGNGGGGAVIAIYGSNGTGIATSGAGSDGAVFIYARGISLMP